MEANLAKQHPFVPSGETVTQRESIGFQVRSCGCSAHDHVTRFLAAAMFVVGRARASRMIEVGEFECAR